MTNRSHCVKRNGTQTDKLVSVGVPQGPILGPLFFILYVNDYPVCLQYTSAHMYADDTTQDVSDKCIDVIEYKLHRDLINTLEWMNKYKLSINFKKTQGMVVCTEERLGTCRNMSIQVDSVIIENMSCAKLLVVYIDKCLTRSEHADILSKKTCK